MADNLREYEHHLHRFVMRRITKVTDEEGSGLAAWQHSPEHDDCPACSARARMLVLADRDLACLKFAEVAPLWKEIRRNRTLRPRTHEATDGYLNALGYFFKDLRLDAIHAGHLREYQIARQANRLVVNEIETAPWTRPAGASTVNHELVVLKQILKHCRLWAPLQPYYFPLRIPDWSPREIPEEDEEERIFGAVKRNPEVALATWVATITNNTSAAGCELRGLRLKHLVLREPTLDRNGVDQTPSTVYIPREATKNDDRPRLIPLNTAAKLAFMQCLRRAYRLGACDPEDYLFPGRVKKGKYDPKRQASRWWLRHNWNKLRVAAELPNLRPHDMRHMFVTRMLEGGEDPETVQAIAGHVGRRTMEYYSHIRIQTKLQAVMRIDPARRPPKKPSGSVCCAGVWESAANPKRKR